MALTITARDSRLGGVTNRWTKFTHNLLRLPKRKWKKEGDGPQRDVMGTVLFCGCQQFSLCVASGQRDMLVVSITASLCGHCSGRISLTAAPPPPPPPPPPAPPPQRSSTFIMDAGLAGFSPGLEVLPAHPSLPAFSFFFYIFVRAACVFRTGETTQESPMLAKKKTIKWQERHWKKRKWASFGARREGGEGGEGERGGRKEGYRRSSHFMYLTFFHFHLIWFIFRSFFLAFQLSFSFLILYFHLKYLW